MRSELGTRSFFSRLLDLLIHILWQVRRESRRGTQGRLCVFCRVWCLGVLPLLLVV
eukprot:EC789904.1.p6 GENE.EC789904.1~~EC789904.1.p6  ORF type:complete len:56 (+),score=0.82 EC789904.1:114-281(+)